MTFEEKLQSLSSQEIKFTLNELLTAVTAETQQDVLDCDAEFYAASDKHAFLAKFEAQSVTQPPERHPELLERWTHFCWLRLEISYLANQKASLNNISKVQMETEKHNAAHLDDPIPALADSVNLAIQEDRLNGVPIERSIKVLQKIMLQIVGTEHPTDPLSHAARLLITELANAISAGEPSENAIKDILRQLQKVDSIPPFRRDVAEEVNRNIRITMDKLYDTLPNLIESILAAYRINYGEELYTQHEEAILKALEGGKQPDGTITKPIAHDASWTGFDADGNEFMTPEVMRYAIRLHRIRAAEKHSETLNNTVVAISKTIERDLRKKITDQNKLIFRELTEKTDIKEIFIHINRQQNDIAQGLVDKKFGDVVDMFQDQLDYLKIVLRIPHNFSEILTSMVFQQHQTALELMSLTSFSGVQRENDEWIEGDLQTLVSQFIKYKEAIRENTNAIEIIDSEQKSHNATDFIIQRFEEIFEKHKSLIWRHEELKMPMRNFGIQLRCFGMTYGVGHIRQDSSIYTRVWDTILTDLQNDKDFTQLSLLSLISGRRYSQLNHHEKLAIQKILQNKQNGILEFIYSKHHARKYHKVGQNKEHREHENYQRVSDELERIEVALRHRDMFENIIISNSECAANIFEVESLLRAFPTYHADLVVVPLLEKRRDLENYEPILIELIKIRIVDHLHKTSDPEASNIQSVIETMTRNDFKLLLATRSALRQSLKNVTLEVMVGFSDTERVSGLAALISVQQVQEDIVLLAEDFGLQAKLYHGPGGDINRGGLRRRDEKATLQGNARSNVLNTPMAAKYYRESQFYHVYKLKTDRNHLMEFTRKPEYLRQWIHECKEEGAKRYEMLHDTSDGSVMGLLFGFMLGKGAHWLVSMLNSSSRASSRGIAENHGDRTASVQKGGVRPEPYVDIDKLRAITATQIKEVLRDYIGIIFGPGFGLRSVGKEKALRLIESSETVRDMFYKVLMGLSLADISFLQHGIFANYPHLIPGDIAERTEWADACFLMTRDMLPAELNPEKMTQADKNQLMFALSRLFALIVEEIEQTKAFAFELMHSIYFEEYHQPGAPLHSRRAIDLLYPFPLWQQQIEDTIRDVMPVSFILARQNNFVAHGHNLDELYLDLNNVKSSQSKLTGVGRLLGNEGGAVTAARIMPPAYYEASHLSYKDDMRMGVARVEAERQGKPISRNRFFAGDREGETQARFEVMANEIRLSRLPRN